MTDVLEIYIIELPKFEKYKEKTKMNDLNSWINFLENPEVIDMKNSDKEIKKAKEVLEEISNDERERRLAELREKYIMDQKAIEDGGFDKGYKKGLEEGIEKGIEEGLEKGIEKGLQEAKLSIAKKMKESGDVDIETISQITNLSPEEIKDL